MFRLTGWFPFHVFGLLSLIVYTGYVSYLNVQVTELIAYNYDVINNEY